MFQKSIRTAVRQIKIQVKAAAAAKSARQPYGSELAFARSATPITFRPYHQEAFDNRTNGIECWLWGRQTGKSFTLASWALDRLSTRPGRTVTILSNSRANGKELNYKCAEVCEVRRLSGDVIREEFADCAEPAGNCEGIAGLRAGIGLCSAAFNGDPKCLVEKVLYRNAGRRL